MPWAFCDLENGAFGETIHTLSVKSLCEFL